MSNKSDLQTLNAKYESLIEELKGKAVGGGGSVETCTVTVNAPGRSMWFDFNAIENGQMVVKSGDNQWGSLGSVSIEVVRHGLLTLYNDSVSGISVSTTNCTVVRDMYCESDGFSIGAVIAIDIDATEATINVS